jgi:hypothetical protein
MTLRELAVEFDTSAERMFEQVERDTVLAWQIVRIWAVTRSKKRLPKLTSVLPKRGVEMQSPTQMRAALQVIVKQFGGRVKLTTNGGTA